MKDKITFLIGCLVASCIITSVSAQAVAGLKLAATIFEDGMSVIEFGTEVVSLFENIFVNKNDEDVHKLLHETFQTEQQILAEVRKLRKRIDLSILQNAVSGSAEEINGCFHSYTQWKEKSNAFHEKQIKDKCDIYNKVNSIGDILKGRTVTFMSTPLPNLLKDIQGKCSGEAISKVFKMLTELYLKGAVVVLAKTTLQNETKDLIDEFMETVKDAGNTLDNIFHDCISDGCNVVTDYIQKLKNDENDLKKIYQNISVAFPWFRFKMFKYPVGTSCSLSQGSDKTNLQMHVFNENGYKVLVISYPFIVQSMGNHEDKPHKNGSCHIGAVEFDSENVQDINGVTLDPNSVDTNGKRKTNLKAPCNGLKEIENGKIECLVDISSMSRIKPCTMSSVFILVGFALLFKLNLVY